MDDGLRRGAALAVGEHMRHNIVPHLVLVPGGRGVVDIGQMAAQLVELFVADVDAELALALRQRQPQPPPGGKFAVV